MILFVWAKDAGAADAGNICCTEGKRRSEVNAGITVLFPRLKEFLGMDAPDAGRYQTLCATDPVFWRTRASCPAINTQRRNSATFENAPQGMRVTDIPNR